MIAHPRAGCATRPELQVLAELNLLVAIQESLGEQTCVLFEQVTYCRADVRHVRRLTPVLDDLDGRGCHRLQDEGVLQLSVDLLEAMGEAQDAERVVGYRKILAVLLLGRAERDGLAGGARRAAAGSAGRPEQEG